MKKRRLGGPPGRFRGEALYRASRTGEDDRASRSNTFLLGGFARTHPRPIYQKPNIIAYYARLNAAEMALFGWMGGSGRSFLGPADMSPLRAFRRLCRIYGLRHLAPAYFPPCDFRGCETASGGTTTVIRSPYGLDTSLSFDVSCIRPSTSGISGFPGRFRGWSSRMLDMGLRGLQ